MATSAQPPAPSKDWVVTLIDLADAARLFAWARHDEYIGRAIRVRRQHRFETRPFRIVTGKRPGEEDDEEEEGEGMASSSSIELPAYKDPAFRDALLGLMGDEALLMELLFPIIVFRCRLDHAQWVMDEMQARHAAGSASSMLLPIQVQPLDERTGILEYLENRRTGQRYYRYRPLDEALLKDWRYIIYEVPQRTPAQFVPEVASRASLVSTMTPPPTSLPSTRGHRPRFRLTSAGVLRPKIVDDDDEDTAAGTARLPSMFRALSWHAADVNLARQTRKMVEAQTAAPQRVFLTRPIKEVLPEALSESARIQAESIADAQLREAFLQQQQYTHFLATIIRDVDLDAIEQSGGMRLPTLGPSKVDELRMAYGLPSPSDTTIALPDAVASVVQQPATCTIDPSMLEREYAERVARLVGGTITLDDILGTPGAMSAASSVGSKGGGVGTGSSSGKGTGSSGGRLGGASPSASKTTAYEQMQHAQQEHFNQALKGEQYAAARLFSFIYDTAFAQLDMEGFLAIIDSFDDIRRRHVFEVMTNQKTPAAYRALDKIGKRRLMIEEVLGEGEHETRELSLAEMKHQLALKLAAHEYVPSTIVFGAAPGEKEKKKALRDQEIQLDDGTHARRLAEIQLLAQQAKDGHVHGDDLRAHNEKLLGLETRKKPPPLPAPAGSSSKKRARPKSSGGGGGSSKKKGKKG